MNNMKGAIFDLDGTILDSSNVWKTVDRNFFLSCGMEIPPNYMEEISAMCILDIAHYTIDKYKVDYTPSKLVEKWNDMARSEYEEKVLIKPYVKEYLTSLKANGVKLGIATALDEELFIPCLKRNGILDLFDDLRSLSEINKSKKDPDIYNIVADNLGVSPSECMVFEDIKMGVISSKNAGFYTIGVYDNDNLHIEPLVDRFIYSFKELLDENIKREKSCGAVIYKMENNEIKFLITKHVLGHYSFTKGHVENNETEVETAKREIKEEVNLEVDIDTKFREIITYSPKANVIKDVVFFIATPTSSNIKLQKEEVAGFVWANYDMAMNLITNTSDKEILKKANQYLEK